MIVIQCELNHNYFSNIDTEDKAYFIGLLLADGSINKRRGEYTIVSLHLAIQDLDIVEKFKYCTESENTIYIGNKSCAIRLTSRQMVKDLANYGIVPVKTGTETPKFGSIPDKLLRHTIRGLIDGDGWYSISNSNTKIVTSVGICGSYNVCDYVQNYFSKVLGTGHLKVSKVKDKNCYKIGYSSLNTAIAIAIVNHLYKDSVIFIDRKKDNANNILSLIY